MKPLSEQDHYEILEISRDATGEEVERSFRLARSTYADDSLAGYSVFGEGEAQALRERVEVAHRVLADADARRAYDATLGVAVLPAPVEVGSSPAIDLPELPELPTGAESKPPASAIAAPTSPTGLEALEALDDEHGDFDGPRLRRVRMHRGMELEDISRVTKISPTHLRFIEEDRFSELPAPVYVRGFVVAYADCVGLDAKRVAASYMKKHESETGQSRRVRFLGSR